MGTARVLLIEDDLSLRECLQEVLEDEGFQVVAVQDAASARDVLRREVPDLLLTDVHVGPGESGLELAHALRRDARTNRLAIVLLSGDPPNHVTGDGVDAVFPKPFELGALVRCLDALSAASAA